MILGNAEIVVWGVDLDLDVGEADKFERDPVEDSPSPAPSSAASTASLSALLSCRSSAADTNGVGVGAAKKKLLEGPELLGADFDVPDPVSCRTFSHPSLNFLPSAAEPRRFNALRFLRSFCKASQVYFFSLSFRRA